MHAPEPHLVFRAQVAGADDVVSTAWIERLIRRPSRAMRTCQGYGMAGAVRTGDREEPMSSDADHLP